MAPSFKILVAEDDRNLGTVYHSILEGAGYQTRVSANGMEALTMVRQFLPDLVITDAILPGMDGFELAEAIRGDPATGALPIVFISGVAEPEDRARASRFGVTQYLSKPIQAVELLSAVRGALEAAGADTAGGPGGSRSIAAHPRTP